MGRDLNIYITAPETITATTPDTTGLAKSFENISIILIHLAEFQK
jgi:hypothetical protein